MPKKPTISKSSFIKGKQCLKALYLQKKYPELQDAVSEGQQAVFDRGRSVGELAQQLFPGGVMAAYDLPDGFMRSIKRTKELLNEGFVKNNKEWETDLKLALKLKVKAEIQALSAFGFEFLTDQYIPEKLTTGDWI